MKQSSVRYGGLLVACLAAALVQSTLAATSYTVGGSSGWTIPSPSTLYSTWLSDKTFKVGDSLVFNFQSGAHTVAEVSKSAYDACTTSNPISTVSTGPATITLSSAGTHYYICTIPGHCLAGQKLAVTVTAAAASPKSSPAAPTASPTSSPAATPTPTPSPAPTTAPTSSPASSPAPATATPASSPSPATAAAPVPSPSSGTATPPSGAASPGTSTVPSSAGSPGGSATAPPPSSASVAGAGLALPLMMIAAAFLV